MILLAGCAKSEESKIERLPSEKGPQAVEDEAKVVTFGNGSTDEKAEETSKFIIEQKDADMLLNEALTGTGCRAVFADTAEIDENGYYTYTVIDPDGGEMKTGLAVDGFSGDVFVYDAGKKKVSSFEGFDYYDSSPLKNRNISWDGRFVLDNFSVELLPADESSFEFTVSKKDKELINGLAVIEEDEASWESEDKSERITFKMIDDKTLQMVGTGKAMISGQYIKE